MLIAGTPAKLLRKALLCLKTSINASLRYCVHPDVAAGYALLKDNAENILDRSKLSIPAIKIESKVEQHVCLVALNRIVYEYENLNKDFSQFLILGSDIELSFEKEENQERESRINLSATGVVEETRQLYDDLQDLHAPPH